MTQKPKRSRSQVADLKCAEAWRGFYEASGRQALAALFTEFDMYSSVASHDPYVIMRAQGQRDVMLRIVQLVGLKPEHFPQEAWQASNALEQLMRME